MIKSLLSTPLGFETIRTGFFEPLRMYIDKVNHIHKGLEMLPSFSEVIILAKKVADFDSDQFKWDVNIEDVLGSNNYYPNRQNN